MVTKLQRTPGRCAKRRAVSSNGMVWPREELGKKKMWIVSEFAGCESMTLRLRLSSIEIDEVNLICSMEECTERARNKLNNRRHGDLNNRL